MKKIIIIAIISMFFCSCFRTIQQERQMVSSAFIGCPAQEITILDDGQGTILGSWSWIAVYKGRKWQCFAGQTIVCTEIKE